MKILKIILALTIVTILVGGGHWFLAKRLIIALQQGPEYEPYIQGGLAFLAGLMFLQPFLERSLPRRFTVVINWLAFSWMGIGFLLLVLFAGSDFVLYVISGALASGEQDILNADLIQSRIAAILFWLAAFLCSYAMWSGVRFPRVKKILIPLKKWPAELNGFHIVQISDIHIGPLKGRKFAKKLVEVCNQLNPDLLVITGDAIDGTVKKIHEEVAPLSQLQAKYGVYFVTGNHEHYYHPGEWCAYFSSLGIKVLMNARITINCNGSAFELAGTHDIRGGWNGEYKEDLPLALSGRSETKALVLLAHDPTTFKQAAKYGVDLQLSGHTHGGQIWPFVYLVKLAVKYVAGIYRQGSSTLYVSRGTGFWGPPMRLFAPQEISLIELKKNQD